MKTEQKRIAIIGCGGRGIESFGCLLKDRDDADIVALCDTNPVRIDAARDYLEGDQKGYASIDALLANETPDAVIITTPDVTHDTIAVKALRAGCDVLIDKPLATKVKGCLAIIETAKQTGKTIMIGFNLRHLLTLKRLKEIIDEGVLGNVFMIENREFYDGGRTYMSRWNRDYAISGGLWIHKGSHDFDVFNWLLGFPKPVKVSATAGVNALNREGIPFALDPGIEPGPNCSECRYTAVCKDAFIIENTALGRAFWGEDARRVDGYARNACMYLSEKSVHDNGIAIVEYENGARASHLECFVTSYSDRCYTVVGDRGIAEVSLERREIIIRPRWRADTITHQVPETEGGHGGADPGLVDAFLNVIKGNQPNSSTVEQGLWSTAIGQAAERSWRENRTVMIEELFR